jgi:hypothetical protein
VAPRGRGGQNFAVRGGGRHGGGRRHFRHFGGPALGFGQLVPFNYGYYGAPFDVDGGDEYVAAPDEEECYLVRRRVRTRSGLRYRRVYVCE